MPVQAGNLPLLGGELCLNFTNTVEWRFSDRVREFLASYSDLALWSRHAGVLKNRDAQRLIALAARRGREARRVVKYAVTLRETIYRIFSAIVDQRSPEPGDLRGLNSELSHALRRLQVVRTGSGYAWKWASGSRELSPMLWPIVRSAADLLVSQNLETLKQCSGCGWLFLDMSKNHLRRWCDMRVCGNRAKARRHYERTRKRERGKSRRRTGYGTGSTGDSIAITNRHVRDKDA